MINYFCPTSLVLLQNNSFKNSIFRFVCSERTIDGYFHQKVCTYFQNICIFSRYLALKMLIFEVFLPVDEPLLATFKECRALTFLKHIVEQGTNIMKP